MRVGRMILDGEFVMTPAQREDPPVRDRSANGAPTSAAHLPPMEIRAAASQVLAESGEMPRDELIMATARLFGFAKTGKDIRGMIDKALPE